MTTANLELAQQSNVQVRPPFLRCRMLLSCPPVAFIPAHSLKTAKYTVGAQTLMEHLEMVLCSIAIRPPKFKAFSDRPLPSVVSQHDAFEMLVDYGGVKAILGCTDFVIGILARLRGATSTAIFGRLAVVAIGSHLMGVVCLVVMYPAVAPNSGNRVPQGACLSSSAELLECHVQK